MEAGITEAVNVFSDAVFYILSVPVDRMKPQNYLDDSSTERMGRTPKVWLYRSTDAVIRLAANGDSCPPPLFYSLLIKLKDSFHVMTLQLILM
jgi:hypothetical protein